MGYRQTDFEKGWWNCFITFSEVGEYYAASGDKTITDVLDGAGVNAEELDYVIEHETMNEKLKAALVRYRQSMAKE